MGFLKGYAIILQKHWKQGIYRSLLPLSLYDLADIDEQAQERFERLIEDVKEVQGTTEQRKTDNELEWIGRVNDIRACAREVVNKEIISTNTFVD